MLKAEFPIRKIIVLVLATSVLIGILAIIPFVFDTKLVFFKSSWQSVLFLLLSILLIWITNFLLLLIITKYVKEKSANLVRYSSSYIVCIALVMGIRIFLVSLSGQDNNENKKLYLKSNQQEILMQVPAKTSAYKGTFYMGLIWGLTLNTLVLLILDMALLKERKQRIEVENAELRIQNMEAVNSQLRQQIHPHFLFNSLNTLKSLIKNDASKAEDYLIKLSDFLRASLISGNEDLVKLGSEIKLCKDYLDMQKMRFGEALRFHINIPEQILESENILGFAVLSLIENAIKHNTFTKEIPLEIRVEYNDGIITVSNNKQLHTYSTSGPRLGLENLKKRYRILSGDEVVVKDGTNTFSVSLKTLKI